MPFSDSRSSAGSDTSTAAGAIPTTIAVAPGRRTSQASRIVAGEPTASNAWSTPPGARASEVTLARIGLDRDDPPGARQARGGHQVLADPAAADHAHRLPHRHPRGV